MLHDDEQQLETAAPDGLQDGQDDGVGGCAREVNESQRQGIVPGVEVGLRVLGKDQPLRDDEPQGIGQSQQIEDRIVETEAHAVVGV